MTKRNPLTYLESRAKAGAAKHPRARVVVTRTTTPAADGDTTAVRQTAELWLYGTVGGYWWGFNSDDVAAELRALGDVDELLVRVHSFGGSAIEGIAIGNLLANHPADIRCVVEGVAASAASMIVLAGNELIMSPGSQLMVHDAWLYTAGNAAELRADADWIDKQSQNYAETYAHRAGGTAAEWRQIMLGPDGEDGTWFSAQEAVDAGLATGVANIVSTTPPPAIPDPADLADDLDGDIELAAALEWDLALIHPAARAAWTAHTQRRTGAPKPPTASALGSNPTQGTETAMTFTSEQLNTMRDKLGLPETADEAAILAAVEAVVDESLDEHPANPNSPAAGLVVPEGMTVISTEILDTLRAGAEDGRAARAEQRTATRDTLLTNAIRDGRIAPSQRDHFAALYDADNDGTTALLAQLAPGLVPVTEIGHDQDAESDADAAFEAAHAALLKQQGITPAQPTTPTTTKGA